jgi:hypothetical protein
MGLNKTIILIEENGMTIKELKDKINSEITNDDRILAVFSKCINGTILENEAFIHTAFCHLKTLYPDYFKNFIFDMSPIVPFSDELSDVLFRLRISDLLYNINGRIHINKIYAWESLRKFTEKEQAIIKQIATTLSNLARKNDA